MLFLAPRNHMHGQINYAHSHITQLESSKGMEVNRYLNALLYKDEIYSLCVVW